MEDRILHSADLAPLLLSGAAEGAVQQAQATLSGVEQVQRSEIVFVDATLDDASTLLADLQAQRQAGRPLEIVLIASGEDGLARIGDTLAGRQGITAVHVLAHGADGALQLGSSTLDTDALLRRAAEVAGWGAALSADADLLLYGCDLAQTALGQGLVRDLAALTGADVAASIDLTGAAQAGGDWELEYRSGAIEAALAPSAAAQSQWRGVLATYTVTTTSDLFLALLPQAGTFRWAVGQANDNPGTDTIVFAVNGTFGIGSLGSGGDDNSAGDFDVLGSVNIVGNGTGNTIITGDGNDRALDLRSGTVHISGVTIQGGTNATGGGMAVQSSANVTLTNVVVQGNVGSGGSPKGAGIYNDGALTLRNVLVQNNGNTSADAEGGGIYVDDGATLDARNVEIAGNNSDSKDGGGIFIKDGATVTLENVTLAGNAGNRGGGIYSKSDSLLLINSTLSGNAATSQGGGLWTEGVATLNHVTVAFNTASVGAGVYDKDGDVRMANSLFSDNNGENTNRALISLGHNLSDDSSAGFLGTGDLKNVSAGLSALAANGGFTRTHAISLGSAARDAAAAGALTMDQRGIAYLGANPDIGAYEFNPFGYSPTVTGIGNQSVNEDTALGPIAFTVGDAETGAGSLVVTASSGNTALVPDANIVIGGSGANRTISVTPAANANSTANGGPVTITITVNDGGNTVTTSFVLTVAAVNDAPGITLPGAQTVAEDGLLTLSGGNAPVIADVDAGTGSVQLTLAVAHGLLTLSQTTGLSFVTGNGSNNASMSFTGTLGAINAALAGLQYRPAANYNGPDQLSFTVNDLGNSGSGGALSASANLGLTVTAVNDAPTLALPGAQVTPQLTPLQFSAGNGNAITLADVDAGSAALQLSLSATALGNGSLTFGSLTGLTLVSGTGSNDTLVVVRGSQADLNAALATLSFSATGPGAAGIDLSLSDLGNTGAGGALLASGAVMVTVDNEAPPVLALSQNTLNTAENDGPVLLDAALTVSDADHATLASATLRFVSGYAAAQDQLQFTNNPGTMGNIVGSFSAGVLSLSSAGATATLGEWQAALRSVAYQNTSESPDITARVLRLTVNDGIADSAAQLLTINVAGLNDAPTLSGAHANDLPAVAEDDGGNAGMPVSALVAGHISDVDAGAAAGIAVVGVDDSNGSWQYSLNGGLNWNAFGAVSDATARLLGVDAATLVRFVPNADWNGTVTDGLSFRAWDQSSGVAGGTANAGSNGGSTAFSSTVASSSVTVTAVNDAPVLAGAENMLPITEDATGDPGTLVSDLIAGHVADGDSAPLRGIAVIAVDDSSGVWQYTRDGGNTWLAFGAVGNSSALLLAADLDTSVRFVAHADWNGTVSNGLRFRAWDQTSGVAGSLADVSVNGGTTAFSAATASSSITVSSVDDAPTVTNPIADQTATQGVVFSFEIPADTFEDIDVGDVLTYSVQLAGGGALPAWLSFNAGTRTFSGTPANADVGTLSIEVTVTDGSGADVTDAFDLVVGNVNDAPTVATPIPDQAATQGVAFSFQFGAGSFADIDAGDTLTYAATLSGGGVLPSWLSFNAATRTFSGTPANADVGNITVRVTATDGSAASVFDDFQIAVANVNDAPTVAAPLADQVATQGSPFTFTFGAGAFADIDAGDTLTYAATLSGGGALPAWLSFNTATRTFSGTPANADVGSFTVQVTATDGSAASVFDDFQVTVANANDAPTVATPLPDQAATQGMPFSFSFGIGSFADIDVGDTLVYSATQTNGAALPSWLSFNAATRTFSGTPANADVGALSVRVIATDSGNASVADDFLISIANVNDAPVLVTPPGAQEAGTGSAWRFQLPASTFIDPDVGDTLLYEASLADGSPLPAWLSFDAATRTFSGTPLDEQIGRISIQVTATDGLGLAAQGVFALTISVPVVDVQPEAPVAPPPSSNPPTPATTPTAVATAATPAPAAPAEAELLTAPATTEAPVDSGPGLTFTVEGATLSDTTRRDGADVAGASHLATRADVVVSEVVVAQASPLSVSGSNVLVRGDEITRRFEELQRQMQQQGESRGTTVASSILVTSGVSIGYVVWLVRGGVLMSSMLSALPAWQMVDPLPVLAASKGGRGGRAAAQGKDADVERYFDERASAVAPAAEPAPSMTPSPAPAATDSAQTKKAEP